MNDDELSHPGKIRLTRMSQPARLLRIVAYAIVVATPGIGAGMVASPMVGVGTSVVVGFALTLQVMNELYQSTPVNEGDR